jgi:hypothetical protein
MGAPTSVLSSINTPDDLKNLSPARLGQLAGEIRDFLVSSVSARGGHLGSNLGVVELTISMFASARSRSRRLALNTVSVLGLTVLGVNYAADRAPSPPHKSDPVDVSIAFADALPPRPTASNGLVLPLAVLIVGMFMSVLDVSLGNVAVPAIQKDFGTTRQDVQWITTAHSLALGVIVPVSCWPGDRGGLTRAYIVSLAGFSLGWALGGLACDLPSTVVFRTLQAFPGRILPVVTLAMVYRHVPKSNLGIAMGLYDLGVVFAQAIGPMAHLPLRVTKRTLVQSS